ncbi:UDP-N-acetylglucosamine--undecaprenyl-phosphate N-acetylglucosaminephosphotransferase [Vibrio astriarenae]
MSGERTLVLDLILVVILSFFSLFCLRKLAQKVGLVDKPNARKKHLGEVPLVGGISVYIGVCVFLTYSAPSVPNSTLYLICITSLIVIGIADDRWDISYKLRLLVQTALALSMIYGADLSLKTVGNLFGEGDIVLGWVSYLLTVFAVIGAINAFNMVDGIDGLLGGLSIVTFGSLSFVLYLAGAPKLGFFCLVIIASVIPYVVMNLGLLGRKRRVFMGDAGSMLIGFSVIWILLSATQEAEYRVMRPVTALWLIAVPLMDMAAIMFRRVRRGDSPFKPDREHLHHIFQRLGFTSRQTLVIICGIALFYASIGIVGEITKVAESLMFGLFVAFFALYAFCLSHVWVITSKLRAWRS